MRLYFEFEDRRRRADVTWPRNEGSILVHVADTELTKKLPSDFIYDIDGANKITFIFEDSSNKRLVDLQNAIFRKLQEV